MEQSSNSVAALMPERRIQGVAVSPGKALGRPCFLAEPVGSSGGHGPVDAVFEAARLRAGLAEVTIRLNGLANEAALRSDGASAELFAAHALILSDQTVESALVGQIADHGAGAAEAVAQVFDAYVDTFMVVADDYLREKAADFSELKAQLLEVLAEAPVTRRCADRSGCSVECCDLENEHLLVCRSLDAHVAARLDEHTCGIVAAVGGPRSHGALVARALGLPTVTGIEGLDEIIGARDMVLVDGDAGELVINPTAATLAACATAIAGPGPVEASAPVPELTVLADLDSAGRAVDAAGAGAEGVGLYRTEMEVLLRGSLLDEETQYELYAEVFEHAPPGPVCIRLFDLGYDKAVPELDLAGETNPALGLRGARLLLQRPELLETQARALARAACRRPLGVLYPMVTGAAQFSELKAVFEGAARSIGTADVSHGVMIELPSACIQADALLELADFASIGSSDLVQYLFALDRETGGAAFDACFDDPALWDLVRDVARSARRAGRPLSVCGALVQDSKYIAQLMDVGVRSVCVEARRIADVRAAVRGAPGRPPR